MRGALFCNKRLYFLHSAMVFRVKMPKMNKHIDGLGKLCYHFNIN